jgi:hypothetical protein
LNIDAHTEIHDPEIDLAWIVSFFLTVISGSAAYTLLIKNLTEQAELDEYLGIVSDHGVVGNRA